MSVLEQDELCSDAMVQMQTRNVEMKVLHASRAQVLKSWFNLLTDDFTNDLHDCRHSDSVRACKP